MPNSDFHRRQTGSVSPFPLCLMFDLGSGGAYCRTIDPDYSEDEWSPWVSPIGTGGKSTLRYRLDTTGTRVNITCFDLETTVSQKSIADLLIDIKAAFGFSIKQLAEILDVTRQILYRWLDPEKEVTLQAKNRERIDQMHSLAERWNRLSGRPIGRFGETIRLVGKKNMMELLQEKRLDSAVIHRAMTALNEKLMKQSIPSEISAKPIYDTLLAKGYSKPKSPRARSAYLRTVASHDKG